MDGERSSIKTKHPYLSDPAVREALNLLVDRASVHKFIYGRTGDDTANFVNAPEKFVSKNTSYEFNIDKAIKLLDEAGWKPGADGVREKNGVKLHAVYQTSINAPRQKTQEIVKQACQKAGISIEIKSVTASVFFSSDVANLDTYPHFACDLQMYTTTMHAAGPGRLHAAVPVGRGREQGEQVPGPQHHPLAERGIRQAVSSRARRSSIRSSARRCSSR